LYEEKTMQPADETSSDSQTFSAEAFDASSPLEAMRLALEAAQAAAQARLEAKQRSRRQEGRSSEDKDAEDVIAATTASRRGAPPPSPPSRSFAEELPSSLECLDDLESLIAEVERSLPDAPEDEIHGELVIKRPDEKLQAWYDLAAEDALPAPLRGIPGPVDVKRLLTALLVEIGDVKRTNALLMEQMTRIEEKLDRNNRQLRQNRPF
jgi:hypothetical protein